VPPEGNKMSRINVVFLVALALVATGCGVAVWWWNGSKEELKLAGVVETQEIRLGSKVGGRVAELLVAENDLVKPGDVLVRLAIPELLAQRDQAKARVAAAKAARDRAYNGYLEEEKIAAQGAYEAAKARYDKLVAGWRVQEQKQAQSELEAAEADFYQANQEFDRIRALIYSFPGATSQKEFDIARAARDSAQAKVNSAQAKVTMIVKEGSRKEDVAEAAGEMQRTKAQWELLRRGIREEDKAAADAELASAQARVKELEASVAEGEIKAPCVASIEVISIRPGDIVTPNQPIVRILKADDSWVKVYVPETKLGQIHKGQSALVTVDSYPGRHFQGKVTYIASISEFLPRNVQSLDERRNQMFGIKITMIEPDAVKIFKPGMAAEVILQ
jgi:HlyD family secretion protein